MKRVLCGPSLLAGAALLFGLGAVVYWFGWWASDTLKGWGLLVLVVLMPIVPGGVLLAVGGFWLRTLRYWPRILASLGAAIIVVNLALVGGNFMFDCPWDMLTGFEHISNSCNGYASEGLPLAIYVLATAYVGFAVWFMARPPAAPAPP
ncbi:MAG: hypothetical protein AB7P50_09410 [Alphaproteobacteria bacterium]